MRSLLLLALLVAACSSDESTPAAPDAPTVLDAGLPDATVADAPTPVQTTACPSTGRGGIHVTGATCLNVTPAATGASGEAATVPSYAIAPTANASGKLVLFLNGSGGSPAGGAVDPDENVYTAALSSGHHVIGLSYRSSQAVGDLCHTDPCYQPTRLTILTGSFQTGAATELADIQPTEGVHERLSLLLRALATAQPAAGWDAFLDGGDIVWAKVIVSGHSQGGGHAALLGKIHPVARIVSLSSPCDRVGKNVASWLVKDASWQSDPSQVGYGFGAATEFDENMNAVGGDTICAAHAGAWAAMQIDASRQFDDAVVCGGASGAHGATIACTANFARLQSLFAP